MNRPALILVSTALLLLLDVTRSASAQTGARSVKIGETAPRLSFEDCRWVRRSLDDFGEPEVLVLFFLDAGCAAVGEALPRVESLWREHGERVVVLGINSNSREGVVDVAAHVVLCVVGHA